MIPLGLQVYLCVVGAYLSYVVPCSVVEYSGLFSKAKLQRDPTAREVALCARMVAFNFAWLLPATYLASDLLGTFVDENSPLPSFPADLSSLDLTACATHFTRIAIFFLLDDLCFYTYHRVLHSVPKLYQWFHKPHHIFTAPFSAASYALHPVEMCLQAVGGTAGPVLWAWFVQGSRLTRPMYFSWLLIRQWQGINDHAGWNLPGGTKAHDRHHQKFNVNYASVFHFIDRLFGTDYKEDEDGGS